MEEPTCGICLENIPPNKRGVLDCCQHAFCEECITKQFQYNARCPLCRREFLRVNGQLQHKSQMFRPSVDYHEPIPSQPVSMLSIRESEERQRQLMRESGKAPKRVILTDKQPTFAQWVEMQNGFLQVVTVHAFQMAMC